MGIAAAGITVTLAWFGVNLLSVGLHSYGFTRHAGLYLGLYIWWGGHAQNKKDIPIALLKCDRYIAAKHCNLTGYEPINRLADECWESGRGH